MRLKLSIIILIGTALGLSGCSSTATTPGVDTIEIKDMKFIPDTITVDKGDTIIWVNKDMVAHNVTDETPNSWSSGVISSDGSWKWVASDSANYYCSIHAVMKGVVKIK